MFDEKDYQILSDLQNNSRVTASEIAENIHMSIPAVTERIKS